MTLWHFIGHYYWLS